MKTTQQCARIVLAATLLLLVVLLPFRQMTAQLAGQVPLNPQRIPQFVDPLPHFAGARVNAKTVNDVYVKAVPHTQVAVSTGTQLATGTVGVTPGIGMANLWVYQIATNITPGSENWTAPLWPAWTIETERNHPLNVHYSNELGGQTYTNVGLVVDQTLHWADPYMVMPPPPPPMTPYDGVPPITVHLHGGEVPPLSDGGPDSWFTPGNVKTGHSFNANPYFYPNTQDAATLWYHDHALGVTRLNVYAGMAGFYFLRGGATEDALHLPGWSGDGRVQANDRVTNLAVGATYLPEIEIVIQDRMFDNTGKLYFPNLPTNPLVHPFWTPEFVGDVITVNGKTWPYLSVAPRRYRFRILNGSNARFYNLSFPRGGPTITQIGTDGGFLDAPVPLLNGPLLLAPGERADVIIDFTLFPPVIKKGKQTNSTFVLGNDARTPFPGGRVVGGNTTGRIMEFVVNGTMVTPDASNPTLTTLTTNVKLTDFLGNPATGVPVVKKRQLTLNEVMGAGGPLEVLVNNTKWTGVSLGTTVRPDFTAVPNDPINPGTDPIHDFTYYSETMDEGTTEIWQIINLTADAHPMHLHLVQFQLMSRQPFNVAGYNAVYNTAFPGGLFLGGYGPPLDYRVNRALPGELIPTIGGNPNVTPYLLAPLRGANANENGWKDTFIMYPGEVTTVIARWAPTDKAANLDPTDPGNAMWFPFNPNGGHGYVWHCHIIDHEDNEMMRPYNVNPNPLAPGSRMAKGAVLAANNKPSSFGLDQNYPNPFNPTTEIRFTLPEDCHVQLKIFNSLGQEVQTLINQMAPGGSHTVKLDATKLASGMYFYRIQAGGFTAMRKMMLLK